MPFEGIGSIELLTEAMKVSVRNQSIIASNIANADTPGYTPVQMDFQATLRQALEGQGRVSLRKTLPQHLDASSEIMRFERLALSAKNDYNKVDLEQEMANLAENTGRYTTYGSLLVKQFKMVKDMLATAR